MIIIKNTQEAVEKLPKNNFTPDLLKDILFYAFLFDTEFTESNINEIVILGKNEDQKIYGVIPEITEEIDGYTKTLYIISDTGEGVVIYKKKDEENG